MADDWEDWENEDLAPTSLDLDKANINCAQRVTAGEALLKGLNEPDMSKFADEDEEEEAPKWEGSVPQPQKPREGKKKSYEDKGAALYDDTPLDDPVAEKRRQQMLIEMSDFQNTLELFGVSSLDEWVPRTAKEHEDYGRLAALKYLLRHRGAPGGHYKSLVKAVMRAAAEPLTAQECKDLETALAGLRADKVKAEAKAAAAAREAGKKKKLNVGRSGGSAGLDDFQFDTALDDDYDDFM